MAKLAGPTSISRSCAAHPRHRECRIAAPGKRHGRPGRQLGHHLGQQCERRAAEPVGLVHHQQQWLTRAAAVPDVGEGIRDARAQLARIGVIVARRQPGGRARIPLRPLRQQRRLAVPGRGRDRHQRDVAAGQPLEQRGARNLAPPEGGWAKPGAGTRRERPDGAAVGHLLFPFRAMTAAADACIHSSDGNAAVQASVTDAGRKTCPRQARPQDGAAGEPCRLGAVRRPAGSG